MHQKLAHHSILGIARKLSMRRAKLLHLIKAAAIYNSKDDEQEVSGVVNETSDDDDNNDASDDDASTDEDEETKAEVFFRDARDIMNRMSPKVGTDAMEGR